MAAALALAAGTAVAAGHSHGAHVSPPDAPPLLDGLGTHRHAVTTTSPLAQRYFDQGLRLVYAFNHDEATRSFREAARLDPGCAMAWWGVALALGPNYNLPIDAERDHAALRRAAEGGRRSRRRRASRERAYIDALAKRYSRRPPRPTASALDRAYADAMRQADARAIPTTSTPPRSSPSR